MNWEAIDAIGEIMGAIAVFLSLIYLGVQIKTNTKHMAAASKQSVANEFRDWLRMLDSDNEAFSVGLAEYPDIPFRVRAKFAAQLHDLVVFYQSAHALYESGTLNEETHYRYLTWVSSVLLTQGGQ